VANIALTVEAAWAFCSLMTPILVRATAVLPVRNAISVSSYVRQDLEHFLSRHGVIHRRLLFLVSDISADPLAPLSLLT
jgi:hypothetical protein